MQYLLANFRSAPPQWLHGSAARDWTRSRRGNCCRRSLELNRVPMQAALAQYLLLQHYPVSLRVCAAKPIASVRQSRTQLPQFRDSGEPRSSHVTPAAVQFLVRAALLRALLQFRTTPLARCRTIGGYDPALRLWLHCRPIWLQERLEKPRLQLLRRANLRLTCAAGQSWTFAEEMRHDGKL